MYHGAAGGRNQIGWHILTAGRADQSAISHQPSAFSPKWVKAFFVSTSTPPMKADERREWIGVHPRSSAIAI